MTFALKEHHCKVNQATEHVYGDFRANLSLILPTLHTCGKHFPENIDSTILINETILKHKVNSQENNLSIYCRLAHFFFVNTRMRVKRDIGKCISVRGAGGGTSRNSRWGCAARFFKS